MNKYYQERNTGQPFILSKAHYLRLMIPVTEFGQIPPEMTFFRSFPAGNRVLPAGKRIGRCKQYSGRNFIVRGNGKIRQVRFTGFHPEVRGIRAGNQPEINVSLRNLAGKVHIAVGCQLKNTSFRGTLIESFSTFWVMETQTRKVL